MAGASCGKTCTECRAPRCVVLVEGIEALAAAAGAWYMPNIAYRIPSKRAWQFLAIGLKAMCVRPTVESPSVKYRAMLSCWTALSLVGSAISDFGALDIFRGLENKDLRPRVEDWIDAVSFITDARLPKVGFGAGLAFAWMSLLVCAFPSSLQAKCKLKVGMFDQSKFLVDLDTVLQSRIDRANVVDPIVKRDTERCIFFR